MKVGAILEERFTGKKGKVVASTENYIHITIIGENQIWPIHLSRLKYYKVVED